MKCLNCEKEFEAKRDSAKFCSANCRVKAHQKRGVKTQKQNLVQMQVVLNTILDVFDKIKLAPSVFDAPRITDFINDEAPQYESPKFMPKSFQQHMNDLPELETEYEYRQKAAEIESATNLSIKQRELLLINMRQSKF